MGSSHGKALPAPGDLVVPAGSGWNKLPLIGAIIAVAGIGGAAALGWGSGRFAFSYLVAYMYGLSIALGALFFVIIQYASRAGWSVLVRRVAETLAATLPVFAVLFIPILLNMETLYHHWLHPEGEGAEIILRKQGYLNKTFFLVRTGIYFLIWCGLAAYFYKQSTAQDQDGDIEHSKKLQKWSYPAIALFGLSITFAAIDWVKSLDPHWFSTMWGVYYFAGAILGATAFLGLVMLAMTGKKGDLFHGLVNAEHMHDIGKFTFGFVVFWAYIAFSQYFLIWYANIPEETAWYKHHFHDNWQTVAIFLAAGHFGVPFFFLMSRHMKRHRLAYAAGAVWILFMHWVDLYWNIMPFTTEHHEPVGHHFAFSPVDALAFVGVLGAMMATFGALFVKKPIIPLRDPRLRESVYHENF